STVRSHRSAKLSVTSSVPIPTIQSSTSSRFTNILCRNRSRNFALDSSGRNSACTTSPALQGGTAFCSAPTAGRHSGGHKGNLLRPCLIALGHLGLARGDDVA